jgi:guanosine-3',5'-bis(diphosphate) 3'-pyrophosphohydrolase
MHWDQDLFLRALDFAAKAHGPQQVPGSGAPYVVHLTKVASEIAHVADGSFDADLALTCALLHDCIEDAGVTSEAISEHFGEAVATGVSALTKDDSLPKSDRMLDSLDRIRRAPREVWMVKLADRITNLEPPPPHWTKAKQQAYVAEARLIHAHLAEAHAGLGARLQSKIVAYERETVG